MLRANDIGILATGTASIVGNIVIANLMDGMEVFDQGNVVGNAVIGNAGFGGIDTVTLTGVVAKNNLVGNLGMVGDCGVYNHGNSASTLVASNNYWGAATGPGPLPADNVCGDLTTVTPFASKPFKVKASIKP